MDSDQGRTGERPCDGLTEESLLPSGPGVRLLKSRWFTWGSWGFSAIALTYVASRLRLSELHLAGINWWLVSAALVMQILPRLLEAVRWQYLLRPLRLGYWQLVEAVYIGTLVSGVLPLAGGDVVRGVMIARQAHVHVVRVLSTELVERLSDAVVIILVVALAVRGLTFSRTWHLALSGVELAVGLLALIGVLLVVRNASIRHRLTGWQPASRASRVVKSVGLEGIDAAGRLSLRALAVCFSVAIAATAINIGSLWCLLRAYHIPLSLTDAAAIFVIIVIGTFLPSTPGNLGSWQFFCVVGLGLFGVSAARAAGFSLVAFALWTLPPVLVGFLALLVSPSAFSQLPHRVDPREPCTDLRRPS